MRLLVHQRAPFRVRNHQVQRGDRKPLAYAAALVHLLVFARKKHHLLHDLANVLRNLNRRGSPLGPCFLRRDGHALFNRLRIVRTDLRADAILERRHNLAARRVVLGIGTEHQRYIQSQPHRIAFDLHVAFLHDVEQRHLDLGGKVGQLVDGKNTPVGARQQSIMHGQLARQVL